MQNEALQAIVLISSMTTLLMSMFYVHTMRSLFTKRIEQIEDEVASAVCALKMQNFAPKAHSTATYKHAQNVAKDATVSTTFASDRMSQKSNDKSCSENALKPNKIKELKNTVRARSRGRKKQHKM